MYVYVFFVRSSHLILGKRKGSTWRLIVKKFASIKFGNFFMPLMIDCYIFRIYGASNSWSSIFLQQGLKEFRWYVIKILIESHSLLLSNGHLIVMKSWIKDLIKKNSDEIIETDGGKQSTCTHFSLSCHKWSL